MHACWPLRALGVTFTYAVLAAASAAHSQTADLPKPPPVPLPSNLPGLPADEQAALDRMLLEIDIPHLHALYADRKLTVTQVTRWYMGRIARYNAIYRAVQTVDVEGALRTAEAQDAEPQSTPHAPLWGVPLVIKANTAVRGLPDTDGWQGFVLSGHEFVASKDATVVARLRAAGAVILGITNMPDFASSDTNRSTAFGRTGNAYDVRFSPGGSSGGTVTAVTSNEALLGTGTDTANSIRMPAGTSSVVGFLPTRGLVSIAGIAPLDWLLDNTGPIARNVTDAAIALGVMAASPLGAEASRSQLSGPGDPLDFRTITSGRTAGFETAQLGPYLPYLRRDALKGKRFGVPAFILNGNVGFGVSHPSGPGNQIRPETRTLLMQAIEQLRAAGAEVVIDPAMLDETFAQSVRNINTAAYRLDGTNQWLAHFGPDQYHSAADYEKAVGAPLPPVLTGVLNATTPSDRKRPPRPAVPQVKLATDPAAEKNYFAPQRAALAAYMSAMDRFHLDGWVYPSAQMPPPDETMPQDGDISSGPHSLTGWVNRIGVPAAVLPAGFYAGGLPFGLELSARPWRDGDLLGFAYAFEQATKARRPPVLVESGLLPAQR